MLTIQSFLSLIQWHFSPLLYKEDLEEREQHTESQSLAPMCAWAACQGVPLKFSSFSPQVWTLNSPFILISVWAHHSHDYMSQENKQSLEYLLQSILENTCASGKETWRIPWADRAGTTSDHVVSHFSYQRPCISIFLPKYSAEIPPRGRLVPFSLQVNEMQSSYPAVGEVHPSREGCEDTKATDTTREKSPSGASGGGAAVPCLAVAPGGPAGDYTRGVDSPTPCPLHEQERWARRRVFAGMFFASQGGVEGCWILISVLRMRLAEASWMWIQANRHGMYWPWNASTGLSQPHHLSRLCCPIC